jgi:hypothetical protein
MVKPKSLLHISKSPHTMHRLLLLPELLVEIITYLPYNDLTHCHLISSFFHKTLKNNLQPFKHPLPDPSIYPSEKTLLPQPIRTLARDIEKHSAHWMTPGILLDISDDYYFWHDGAYSNLLHALSPFLHPLLASCAVEVVSGLESLVVGEMGIVLRTKMGTAAFWELFGEEEEEGKEREGWRVGYLTKPSCKVVEVYCPMGALWDEGYGNVLRRQRGREWQQRCVRVERERGVRMGDVVDELRGVLKVEMDMEAEGQEVVLEWRFGASADSVPVSVPVDAYLDGSG